VLRREVAVGGIGDEHVELAQGGMSRIIGRLRPKIPANSWIGRMLPRKPKMFAGIALANKMARQIWAMLVKNEDYRSPAMATAA
jgi:hypothetical protein